MADATQQQRLVLPVGTQAAVEGETATLSEALLAIDSTGEIIGYSTDSGSTWVWPAGGSGSVWHPVMAQDPSDSKWYVVVDEDGTAVMAEAP